MTRPRKPLLTLSLALLAAAMPVRAEEAPYNTEKTPGAPMDASEAARTMELPPGFRAEVFAAEPEVRQPIAMSWDGRGRLWVAECYTYAERPMRWDTALHDRIVIFEDTDGDGRADKRTVFWDQGTRLTSIEVGKGGVYALCPPNLLFIPNANGDDVPDGAAQVLLDGFAYKSIGHNIANGLQFGPDGWLYGRQGILDTSAVGVPGTPEAERARFNCGVFRYNPVKHTVEVVCQGGTNSWGMDWDARGEMFWTNTVIGHLWHGIPGAYYRRMFGAHLNPHAYEVIEQTADHFHFDAGSEKWSDLRDKPMSSKTDAMGGGHAHVGCLIYQGGQWPAEYDGRLLTCNLHGHRINTDILERQGCGYVGKHGPDFMKCKDPWFRGIDLRTGPDGNVYVLDWSDAGECHDNDGIHRTSGRIYKISYGEAKKLAPFDLAKMSEAEVAKLAAQKNSWWRETSAKVRGQVLAEPVIPTVADAQSADGLVRLHAASGLQRMGLEERFAVAAALAAHGEDAEDRQQPLMIWYGIEPAVVGFPQKAVELAAGAKIPTVRRLIARRLVEDLEKAPGPVDALLMAATGKPEVATDVARGTAEALRGVSQAQKPAHWDAFAKSLKAQDAALVRDVELVFGSGRAADELVALVKNTEADPMARRSAFDALLRNAKPEYFDLVKSMIGDWVLGTAARLGCAKFPDADVPKLLLASWPEGRDEWRGANVSTLTSRVAWAKALLGFIEKHPATRADITPFLARQIRSFGDEALTAQLVRVWGDLRDTPEAKKQELEQWRTRLTPEFLAKGDAAKGKQVFSSVCGVCHKIFGEGGAIAPDLTGSDRKNLSYLLENIVDPSAVVPADYRVSVIKLKDGRVLTGVIPEQTEKLMTVQTPTERLTIEKSLVAEQTQLTQSLMPEGLLPALGEEKVKDLFAYLRQ